MDNQYKPSDYYFSSPMKIEGEEGFESTFVILVPKSGWDSLKTLDNSGREVYALNQMVNDILGEAQEGIYESLNCDDGEKIMQELGKRGMAYNPELDFRLQEWAQDSERTVECVYGSTKAPRPKVYMMIGLPASGKSTKSQWFEGMHAKFVSRDLCGGSKPQARKQLEDLLSQGETIVIDDTNYNKQTRAEVIDLVQKYNPISLTAVYMDVDKETCLKRNETRAKKVPAIAIHTLAKKFEPPTFDEGFTDILRFDENGKGKSS